VKFVLSLTEEYGLRAFKNRVLRIMFETKRNELTKVLRIMFETKRNELTKFWRIFNSDKPHNLNSMPDIWAIRSRTMRKAGTVSHVGGNCIRILVGNPRRKVTTR
jgi:hypothetical protein